MVQRLRFWKKNHSRGEAFLTYNKEENLEAIKWLFVHNKQNIGLGFVYDVGTSKSKKLSKILLTNEGESGRILKLSREVKLERVTKVSE